MVWKKTRPPSCEIAANEALCDPLPPLEIQVVFPPERSYTSKQGRMNRGGSEVSGHAPSVSPATSVSLVSKKTRVPSSEMPPNSAGWLPFPPSGPIEMWVVVPPERW